MLVMERIKWWRQLFECFLCMDAFLKSISKSTANEETVYSSFSIRWTVCGCSLRPWNLVWKELQMEKETVIFYLLPHSPNGCNGWGWARVKAGTQNFLWVSLVVVEALRCSPAHINCELDWKWSSCVWNWHPCGIASITGDSLVCCATMPAPTDVK